MTNRLLCDTLARLALRPYSQEREVTHISLSRSFSVITLDDGSVGACMGYYSLSAESLVEVESRLRRLIPAPALSFPSRVAAELSISALEAGQSAYVATSILASTTSALSAPLIRDGGDETFQVTAEQPAAWLRARHVLIIGYGGYLRSCAALPNIKTIHLADLCYDHDLSPSLSASIDNTIQALRIQWPAKTIFASRSVFPDKLWRNYDLVAITGSTLCNGSLEKILACCDPGATIIVQGQSVSIHPGALFESGVTYVSTTLKPTELTEACNGDYRGDAIARFVEDGLPWLYLTPRETTISQPSPTAER